MSTIKDKAQSKVEASAAIHLQGMKAQSKVEASAAIHLQGMKVPGSESFWVQILLRTKVLWNESSWE